VQFHCSGRKAASANRLNDTKVSLAHAHVVELRLTYTTNLRICRWTSVKPRSLRWNFRRESKESRSAEADAGEAIKQAVLAVYLYQRRNRRATAS